MKTSVSAATISTSAASTAATVSSTTPATVAVKPEIITTSTTTSAFTAPLTTNTTGLNKRPASLDLNKITQAKKQRTVAPSPLILESPDLQNMKTLNTPDLEKILLSSQLMQTPQPGTVFPSKVGQVTSEQEEFGKGFEEALSSLHNSSKNSQASQLVSSSSGSGNGNGSNNSNVTSAANAVTTTSTTGMSGGTFTYTDLAADNNFQATVKVEPSNSANSPPLSPIDMETQEKIKLERKRQRNRVAASKCRKRKLERISKLEDRVKVLKGENSELGMVVKSLKDHVAQLKQQVMDHINTGCAIQPVGTGSLLQGK